MPDLSHSNHDVIDSRDVIERLNELQEELDDLEQIVTDAQEALDDWSEPEHPDQFDDFKYQELSDAVIEAELKVSEWKESYSEEYEALKALDEDGSSCCPDWRHGESLISDDYFETYARELAHDIGSVDNSQTWPQNHIDWEAAAEALKQDYNEVDFMGTTFLYRS